MEENFPIEPAVSKNLLAVLLAMSAKQRIFLAQFLAFEPFDGNLRIAKLFALIDEYHLQAKKPKSDWQQDLQAADINAAQFNKLQTYLHQKVDQFLAFQQILHTPNRYYSYTLEAYNALPIDFATKEKRMRQLSKKLQTGEMSIEHFQQIQNLAHFWVSTCIEGGVKVSESYFSELHQTIDLNYTITKLKYLCASINEASIHNVQVPVADIQRFEPLLKELAPTLPPLGMAYWSLFQILVQPFQALETYQAAFKVLVDHQADCAEEERGDLLNYLLNLSNRRLALGENEFEALIVQIYAQLMDANLLCRDGNLQGRTFKNIISINCRQKNFDWCLSFIEDYQKFLMESEQVLLPHFCKGLVAYYRGDFVRSGQIFKDTIDATPDDLFFGIESRQLLLRSYFYRFENLNADEYEDFHRLLESFRMYVRRNNKLSSHHKTSYLNFIHYFGLLLRHLEQHGRLKPFPESWHQEIEKIEFIPNKKWLLEVLSEKSEK